MLGVRPRSPSAEPAPCCAPQPAAPGLEAPAGPAGAALASTSVVLLAAGCSLQLPLDGVDLLLQPEPTSLLQVSLQGHTIVLVPEGILDCARPDPGRLGRAPDGLQVTALLDAPGDHQVVVVEESWESVPDIARQEDACDQDAEPGILEPWMAAPAGTAAGFLPSPRVSIPQDRVPEPWSLASSSNAESGAPRPTWDLDSCMLRPFPSSPLQPLPPSPLLSPQAQSLPHSPRPQNKVRRRLFHE